MLISELAERTGVPVATLKFYLREGVLQPGQLSSRTRADYSEGHVERVRLVRALSDVGGMSLSKIRTVVEALDDPTIEAVELMGRAQRAMLEAADADSGAAAYEWCQARGWRIPPDDPLLGRLEHVLAACEDGGVPIPPERLAAYADASEEVARTDLASIPEDRDGAVRQVVIGTVLSDQLLQVLRRLAQQHLILRDLPASDLCD